MNWKTYKKELLKDPEVKEAFEELKPEYEIAKAMILAMILARINHKMTQKELAKKLNTKQSVISRVESAQTTPTVSFLKRFAKVFGATLTINFKGI
jgi:ribosome-binding protein aMBF1 (putative translation factor)